MGGQAVTRRPIGLAVAVLALCLAGFAAFLFDSGDAPPAPVTSVQAHRAPPPAAAPQATAPASQSQDDPSASPPVQRRATPVIAVLAVQPDPTRPDSTPTMAVPPTPPPSPPPAPTAPASIGPHPLSDLSEAASALAAVRPGEVGIVVLDLKGDRTFASGGETYYDIASLAKVPLMLTVLEHLRAEGRALDENERLLLELMIQWSDNGAATELWQRLQGGDRQRALLESLAVWPRLLRLGDGWGDLRGSAQGVALLFAEIARGDQLAAVVRDEAMGLLAGVSVSQRWGVSAGLPDNGARVDLKNGWYPTEAGWAVHSAGYVLDAEGRPDYVLAILTHGSQTLDEGIAAVENMATAIHAAMRPDASEALTHTETRDDPAATDRP